MPSLKVFVILQTFLRVKATNRQEAFVSERGWKRLDWKVSQVVLSAKPIVCEESNLFLNKSSEGMTGKEGFK